MKIRTLWYVLLVLGLVMSFGCGTEPAGDGGGDGGGDQMPSCTTDTDCDVGSICEGGKCQVAACPEIFDPVCGVDGQTYGNDCEARAAHVEVAHEGECAQICGGIQGLPCPDGLLCDLPEGECQSADLQGLCVPEPEVCTEQFEPVCGCDGMTYTNDCFRLMAGVQKDHDGECGKEDMADDMSS